MSWLKYSAYSKTGTQLIDHIPEGWTLTRLSRLLRGIKDGTHGSVERVSDGYPLLSAKNVHNFGLRYGDDESFISNSDHNAITAVGYPMAGDVLLTVVGTIGRACVYELDHTIAFQRSVCFLRTTAKLIPSYLSYSIQSRYFQKQLDLYAKTSAQPGIYMGDVAACIVICPSVREQDLIVSFLNRETAKIDKLIAMQEQLIAALREDRTATIIRSTTMGIAPGVEMTSFESGDLEIPAHWQVQPVKRLGRLITGGTPPTSNEGNYSLTNEGLPWFRPEDLDTSGRASAASRYISTSGQTTVPLLPAPSVHVVSIGATLGKVGYVETQSSSNQQITAVIDSICPRYTYYALIARYDRIWASSMGNTLPIISAGRLGAVPVPVPPVREQVDIANYLDAHCAKVDKLIAKSADMVDTLREYRSTLITDAVTGMIDVRGVA